MTINETGQTLKCRPLRAAAFLLGGALCAAVLLPPELTHAQAPASAAGTAIEPLAMVKAVVERTTEVMRDTRTPLVERDKKLREIAEANFDFTNMARTTLGYHWGEITKAQQDQFVPLFTSFMEDVYLSKIKDYTAEKVRQNLYGSNIRFTGQSFNGADYAEVRSSVLLLDQPPPIKADYLLKRDGASWKIYDLDIDSLSVMGSYRNQFSHVFNNQGFPALIAKLQEKVQELASMHD